VLGNFTTLVQLTRDPGRDMAPAWSPDGSFIVFMSNRSNSEFDLFKMNADGTGVEQLTRGGANSSPEVSPDGSSVAYHNGRDIHILNLQTRQIRRVTYEPLNGMHPTWSPDGRQLAFMTWRNGRTEIFTSTADGSNQELLVRMPSGDAVDPRWSPNGDHIAFVHVTGGAEASSQQRVIFVVNVKTRRLNRVSR
jgi:Tol biopolymer transport system component